MTGNTISAKKALEEKGYTCVLCKGDDMLFSFEHGVKPLLAWIDEGKDLAGYGAADQVPGKAADRIDREVTRTVEEQKNGKKAV